MSGSDKRGAKRLAYPCEAECTGIGEGPLKTRLSDVSASGAFIDSLNPVPVGSRMTLKFTLPTGGVVVNAEVVHSMPQFGMGVRFLDLSEEQRRRIERAVEEGS